MPKAQRVVITDDFDGKELSDDTKPMRLSVAGWTYDLYLSDKNQEALMKAVKPFTENAELVEDAAQRRRRSVDSSNNSANKEKMKKVREWAQATGFKFKDAQGNEKTLGDRGRIPDEVVAAYDAAN
jgi:O-methyltransferase involved in polyketide biosynthesis